MKKILWLIAGGLFSTVINAQVGIGTLTPNKSAQLEIAAKDKGILIPRIPLKSITDAVTISNGNVESLLVFNTNPSNSLSRGYYFWMDNRWNRIINETDLSTVLKTVGLVDGTNTTVESSIDPTDPTKTNWKVNVATAKGAQGINPSTLGVVKEAAVSPSVTISQDGELAVSFETMHAIKQVNQDYSAKLADVVLFGDASTSSITIALPNPVNNKGKKFTIKKYDDNESNFVNVIGQIEGVSGGLYTALPYSGWNLVSDGTIWKIVEKF